MLICWQLVKLSIYQYQREQGLATLYNDELNDDKKELSMLVRYIMTKHKTLDLYVFNDTNLGEFTMCLTPIYVKGKYVACGNCIECQMLYSSTWAFRIGLEAQLYEHNCFITLTYNEDNRPKDDHLSKRDLQLFLKRLRKHFNNKKIRFFACGEYGDKKGRPHYHIILFNCNFEDMYFFSYDNKKMLYIVLQR